MAKHPPLRHREHRGQLPGSSLATRRGRASLVERIDKLLLRGRPAEEVNARDAEEKDLLTIDKLDVWNERAGQAHLAHPETIRLERFYLSWEALNQYQNRG